MEANQVSEAEKNAFFAQIAMEERQAIDAHDDLVSALQTILQTAEQSSFQAVGLCKLREIAIPVLRKAGAA